MIVCHNKKICQLIILIRNAKLICITINKLLIINVLAKNNVTFKEIMNKIKCSMIQSHQFPLQSTNNCKQICKRLWIYCRFGSVEGYNFQIIIRSAYTNDQEKLCNENVLTKIELMSKKKYIIDLKNIFVLFFFKSFV